MKTKSVSHLKWYESLLLFLPVVLFGLLCLFPFLSLLSGSLSDNVLVKENGVPLFPRGINLDAYRYLFRFPEELLTSYALTIGVSVVGTLLNVLLCLFVAYPLSDVNFRFRKLISFLLFFTMLFSAGIIPIYIFVRRIYALYDTFSILVLNLLVAPGHVFTLRIFLQAVPSALYESARIDGANEFRILFQIALPVIKPGLVTVLLNSFIMYWNDPMTAMLFTDRFVPLALYTQRWESYLNYLKQVQQGLIPGLSIDANVEIPDMTVRFAMGVMSVLPLLCVFIAFQSKFVKGLTAGAVKG